MLSEALYLQSRLHPLNEATSTKQPPHRVLLIGDMNIAPSHLDGYPQPRTSPDQHVRNRADFNAKFLDPQNTNGFCGVDVWRHLHGAERKYTYFPRRAEWGSSCDRVDLVVAGKGLVSERRTAEGAGLGEEEEGEVGRSRGEMRRREIEMGDGSHRREDSGLPVVVGMHIYDNELDRGHSDHVPMSVTLDLARLKML